MSNLPELDPNHLAKRNLLRLVGPIVFGTGLLLVIIAAVCLISADGEPHYVWLAFIGMPLMFAGSVASMLGFMGAMARYQTAEGAPVAKDAINYMADGVKPAIKSVTSAVMEGIADAGKAQFCTSCGHRNDADAKFCKSCGHPI